MLLIIKVAFVQIFAQKNENLASFVDIGSLVL